MIKTISDLGRKGGKATLKKYGNEHYSKLASMSGKAVLAKYGREYFVELAKKSAKKRRKNKENKNETGNQIQSVG